jgi:integral membrane protein
MSKLISTHIGRLRTVAFLEGITLVILVLIGMPMKYLFDMPLVVEVIGPLHG